VDHVRVGLHDHEVLDLDRAVLAHPSEVVAAEVDQHHVLGALLLVGQQLGGDRLVVLPARAGARDGPRARPAAGHRQQRLRRGADDLEVLEVQEVHVRRRVAPPAARGRSRTARRRRAPTSAGSGRPGRRRPRGCSPRCWRPSPRTSSRGTLDSKCGSGRGGPPACGGSGPAERSPTSSISPCAERGRLRAARVVEVGVGQDRHRVLQVVEGDEDVREHERHVRESDDVGIRLAQRLDGPHAVEAEEAHRAAVNGGGPARAPGGDATPRRPRARRDRRRLRASSAGRCAAASR
jgi:hypothetical protein